MTHEEMERAIEFILKQQAQFTMNIQKLEEAQSNAERRMDRMEGAFVGLVNLIGDSQKQTQAQISEIAQAQKRTEAALAETNERVAEISERLNSFIVVVERYINKNQNGSSQS